MNSPAVEPSPEEHATARPRRTVRIVGTRSRSWAAYASLLTAVLVALVILIGWQFWQSGEVSTARQRKLAETDWEWKCDVGHSFRASLQAAPRECWTCGRPAYPVARYTCPVHGTFEVAGRFVAGEDGSVHLSQLRLAGHDWVSSREQLRCPRCGRPLTYNKDPLAEVSERKKHPPAP